MNIMIIQVHGGSWISIEIEHSCGHINRWCLSFVQKKWFSIYFQLNIFTFVCRTITSGIIDFFVTINSSILMSKSIWLQAQSLLLLLLLLLLNHYHSGSPWFGSKFLVGFGLREQFRLLSYCLNLNLVRMWKHCHVLLSIFAVLVFVFVFVNCSWGSFGGLS